MAEQIQMESPHKRGHFSPLRLLHPVPDATTTTPSALERGDSSSPRDRSSTAAITTAAITTTTTITTTNAITAAYAAVKH
ncbi:hypothetical protein A9Z42_0025340 [Trichoderma parareesei]|uniref:Uncharacterized protein n=1 Tax=Trichoderma parareesei TaxID=858221 RepID=A0A2H2ZGN6_TRIPA|nr:hypothetical protein A9Z42_0025340 [Trichoderma parareesei]